eukprot:CAMPEP_0203842302 /NCGR_PEP_ID=MMETSP0359-20131031/1910_1 /ASSEMBLY_ACC=CAM_ASM_000338 /TAXON_ID=268821 /ORGANISM="Scrippsiella Hangoei, Strain SHTV-5" /LENGTH=72 /DNA_ID=CAMNT_0050756863 /DNA_START=236 /DNA_END=454 /DNA_ORIENTATION=-
MRPSVLTLATSQTVIAKANAGDLSENLCSNSRAQLHSRRSPNRSMSRRAWSLLPWSPHYLGLRGAGAESSST